MHVYESVYLWERGSACLHYRLAKPLSKNQINAKRGRKTFKLKAKSEPNQKFKTNSKKNQRTKKIDRKKEIERRIDIWVNR